jgi:hypothetical protein
LQNKEKVRREAILLDQFNDLIKYLNQFPPEERKIKYIAWDMAHASKSNNQDVIAVLESIAEEVIQKVGFFHSGPEPFANILAGSKAHGKERLQHGILRTNCVDCLDRTNAAQFVVAKEALGHQLYALGVISEPTVPFDSDAVNLLNVMYHDHGDTIALQYGGSHLVNTMETYRKISPWISHSRDMIESIRRYYSNSFTDAEKQDAMNLFLGNFIPDGKTHLWDLPDDFSLHHADPRNRQPIKSYIKWWTDSSDQLLQNKKPNSSTDYGQSIAYESIFVEYYRPNQLTTFTNLFAFHMISTMSTATR